MLKYIIQALEEYIATLIDVAEMPEADKAELKAHLQAAEVILLRNGCERLRAVLAGVGEAILGQVR